jgi:hypothetical protein
VLCACGGAVPPPPPGPQARPAAVAAAPASEDGFRLGKTTLRLTYALTFADSEGTVEIWIDGEFVRVDETWRRANSVPSMRWATTRARMLFDRQRQVLIVVNLEDNAFTRVTRERIAEENERLASKPKAGIGGSGGSEPLPAASEFLEGVPSPVETPVKPHPAGCTAFARELPKGLREETCFNSWERFGLSDPDMGPLVSLAEMVGEIARPPSEIDVIIALADALGWDAGILVSRQEFGVSPFGEDDTAGLQPWDEIATLKQAEQVVPSEEDFAIPEKAEERFTLFPWKNNAFL